MHIYISYISYIYIIYITYIYIYIYIYRYHYFNSNPVQICSQCLSMMVPSDELVAEKEPQGLALGHVTSKNQYVLLTLHEFMCVIFVDGYDDDDVHITR